MEKIKEVSKEQFKKDIKGKEIVFHEEFNKGMRLWLCLNCGFPTMFMGKAVQLCYCNNCKPKIYPLKKLNEFILKLQEFVKNE